MEADCVFRFTALIKPGKNVIKAQAGSVCHQITVNGVSVEDPAYKLGEGQGSFVRNWFEASDEIDESRLSLNDNLGTLVNNPEIRQIYKNQFGKELKLPSVINGISVKPAAKLLARSRRGKQLTDMANQYLQGIKKE